MKPFSAVVGLKNGNKIKVDVKLEWAKDFGDGDYDFDFSLWQGDQKVLEHNIRSKDVEKIMSKVDEQLRVI